MGWGFCSCVIGGFWRKWGWVDDDSDDGGGGGGRIGVCWGW